MSNPKTSSEGQMGSGESDDEFYNVKLPNTPTVVNEYKDNKNKTLKKVYSPPRTKVKYNYKFDSSSDDDSDDTSSQKKSRAKLKSSDFSVTSSDEKKKEESSGVKNKLSQNTTKVVQKINEELKSMKSGSGNKLKFDKSDSVPQPVSSAKHIPASVGMVPPVVVVPPPMIVPQPHSVMTMGGTGMIVSPTIGIGNQNVMIPPPNMLNLQGNVMRGPNSVSGIVGASGTSIVGIGNPNIINPIQRQGSVVGMTNDILRLQGNVMGITSPGNMMQMPGNILNQPAVAGICMTGNMIPMQGNIAAMQSSCGIVGMQGPSSNIMGNQAIMNSQGNILGNPNGIMNNPGGVMMNPGNVMTVTNLMNNQGNMLGNVGNVMGNSGNMMLNMNSLVNNPGNRMNYPGSVLNSTGNILNAQAKNNQVNIGSRNTTNTSNEVKNSVHYTDAQNKSAEKEWKESIRRNSGTEKTISIPSTSPNSLSPSDSDSKNWDGNEDEDDDDGDDDDGDDKSYESNKATGTIKEIPNTFKNDGSFMEIFKKMNEANNSKGSANKDEGSSVDNNESDSSNVKKPPVILSGIVGKRRGGRVLKTGLVKKVKKLHDSEEEKGPKDAWAMYMAEVKKYREASCEEEGKTRPLVK